MESKSCKVRVNDNLYHYILRKNNRKVISDIFFGFANTCFALIPDRDNQIIKIILKYNRETTLFRQYNPEMILSIFQDLQNLNEFKDLSLPVNNAINECFNLLNLYLMRSNIRKYPIKYIHAHYLDKPDALFCHLLPILLTPAAKNFTYKQLIKID